MCVRNIHTKTPVLKSLLKKLQAFRSTYRKSGTQDPKVGPSSIKFFFPFPLLKSRAASITEMRFE